MLASQKNIPNPLIPPRCSAHWLVRASNGEPVGPVLVGKVFFLLNTLLTKTLLQDLGVKEGCFCACFGLRVQWTITVHESGINLSSFMWATNNWA